MPPAWRRYRYGAGRTARACRGPYRPSDWIGSSCSFVRLGNLVPNSELVHLPMRDGRRRGLGGRKSVRENEDLRSWKKWSRPAAGLSWARRSSAGGTGHLIDHRRRNHRKADEFLHLIDVNAEVVLVSRRSCNNAGTRRGGPVRPRTDKATSAYRGAGAMADLGRVATAILVQGRCTSGEDLSTRGRLPAGARPAGRTPPYPLSGSSTLDFPFANPSQSKRNRPCPTYPRRTLSSTRSAAIDRKSLARAPDDDSLIAAALPHLPPSMRQSPRTDTRRPRRWTPGYRVEQVEDIWLRSRGSSARHGPSLPLRRSPRRWEW